MSLVFSNCCLAMVWWPIVVRCHLTTEQKREREREMTDKSATQIHTIVETTKKRKLSFCVERGGIRDLHFWRRYYFWNFLLSLFCLIWSGNIFIWWHFEQILQSFFARDSQMLNTFLCVSDWPTYFVCSCMLPVWPDKNRPMSIKVAQKWFH